MDLIDKARFAAQLRARQKAERTARDARIASGEEKYPTIADDRMGTDMGIAFSQ